MYVGERCSIVTWPAFSVSAGIMLTAVAPLPITTRSLAGVVQRFRPVLRMHHLAREVLEPREIRPVGLVVVVVAGAEEQEPAAVGLRLAVDLGLHRPGVGGRIPIGRQHAGVEADVLVDAVLARGLGQVITDVMPVGDVLRSLSTARRDSSA